MNDIKQITRDGIDHARRHLKDLVEEAIVQTVKDEQNVSLDVSCCGNVIVSISGDGDDGADVVIESYDDDDGLVVREEYDLSLISLGEKLAIYDRLVEIVDTEYDFDTK